MTCGVVMVVYGKRAEDAAHTAQAALAQTNPQTPVTVYTTRAGAGTDAQESRHAKTTLLDWTPYEMTAYLDADTVTYTNVSAGFDVLRDGWDMVITPSANQGDDGALWHVGSDDRAYTLDRLRYTPLQLQAGVMFVRRNARTRALFAAWHQEWKRFRNQDQAALLRALALFPVRLWLFGRPWNGGAVIGHRFGATRA